MNFQGIDIVPFFTVCLLAPNWWLARISEMSPTQQKGTDTQAIHASLVGISMVVMTTSCVSFYFLLLKAAENLHNKMAMTIVKAPVLFYDTNPGGRILNRFSKDVGTIDDVLPIRFLESVTMCLFSSCCDKLLALLSSSSYLKHIYVLCTLLFSFLQRAEENRSHQM